MTITDTRPKHALATLRDTGKVCAVDDCDERTYLKQAFTAPEGHLVTIPVCSGHNGLRDILASSERR